MYKISRGNSLAYTACSRSSVCEEPALEQLYVLYVLLLQLLLQRRVQQTLELEVEGVAVAGLFVWAGPHLLGLLGTEGVRPSALNVHLQLQQDLQRVLQLTVTERETKVRMK